MFILARTEFLEHLHSPMAIIVVLIGAVISGFFLQWASRIMGIFSVNYSTCFLVALIGIIADYGVLYIIYVENYIGAFVGSLLNIFINLAIIVGFFKIGWIRSLFLYILVKILWFIIGCLCCCGITHRFPSL